MSLREESTTKEDTLIAKSPVPSLQHDVTDVKGSENRPNPNQKMMSVGGIITIMLFILAITSLVFAAVFIKCIRPRTCIDGADNYGFIRRTDEDSIICNVNYIGKVENDVIVKEKDVVVF